MRESDGGNDTKVNEEKKEEKNEEKDKTEEDDDDTNEETETDNEETDDDEEPEDVKLCPPHRNLLSRRLVDPRVIQLRQNATRIRQTSEFKAIQDQTEGLRSSGHAWCCVSLTQRLACPHCDLEMKIRWCSACFSDPTKHACVDLFYGDNGANFTEDHNQWCDDCGGDGDPHVLFPNPDTPHDRTRWLCFKCVLHVNDRNNFSLDSFRHVFKGDLEDHEDHEDHEDDKSISLKSIEERRKKLQRDIEP